MATKINTRNTKTHGIIRSNAARQAQGNLDASAVVARAARAVSIVNGAEIYALGSKVNGWGETVEAYKVVSTSGRTYEVQIRPVSGQPSCNCPDWIYRRKAHGGLCKHGLAVKSLRA